MCTKIVMNKLYLGNRELGYELFSDGEIVEMTEKQIISEIKNGKGIRGLVIGDSGKLELDAAGFGMRNLMEKRHIGNYKPMIEDGCMVNMFVTVIGSKETENGVVYEGITNRFKRVDLDEALLVTYYNMGIINGGVILKEDGTLDVPKCQKETIKEQVQEVETTVEAEFTAEPETEESIEVENTSEEKTEPVEEETKKKSTKGGKSRRK
ncbi:MAG: hypothetical protein J6O61_08030 [Butyrivibrio sp.]|uniref:hypothetical protein n=1 Tax=Butyrivibrio sp. TaxID=28121 RepID=UPI001B06EC7C|nr:hypothetical protein [Butyrivibrio sp.]MBO6240763.1 hypothetical protein [Butyrivibrio sp.]